MRISTRRGAPAVISTKRSAWRNLLFALLLTSCISQMGSEEFIRGSGPYAFPVDFSDSLCSYDIAIYSRIDTRETEVLAMGELPLTVVWTAPDGKGEYAENVYLPLEGERRGYFSRQVWQQYRKGVRPAVYGEWTLTVSLPDTVRVRGLRGIGLEVLRNYGTR